MRSRWLLVLVLLGLALTGCGAPKETGAAGQPQGAALRITIGTQEFPEARILGELWRQALAVNGYTVDLRKNVGPAADLDELLRDGEIDGYVAYTGTVLSVVAGEEVTGLDPQETYDRAEEFYAGRGMAMSPMTGFENKDAMAVTTAFAQQNGLRSIGDLASLDSFVLGARGEFEDRELGLGGLQRVYGLTNARFSTVALGAQYDALDRGDADVVDAFTTDPQLRSGRYVLLADPELLFGSQNVVMTVDADKLETVGRRRFLAVVGGVNRRLTQEVMVDMNAAVTEGEDEADVARAFLRRTGLDEPVRVE